LTARLIVFFSALARPTPGFPNNDDSAFSPPSPFGRKVKLALGILGLDKEVTIEKADPTDLNDSIRRQNRSARFPADHRRRDRALRLAGDPRISRSSRRRREDHLEGAGRRFKSLQLEALADGILDAGSCWSTRAVASARDGGG